MKEHPSFFRRAADNLGVADAVLSMFERLWRWWPIVIGAYTYGSYLVGTWLHRYYSEWLTAVFVVAAGSCGAWLIHWLTARSIRYSAERTSRTSSKSAQEMPQAAESTHSQYVADLEAEADASAKVVDRLTAEVTRERADKGTLAKEITELGAAVQNCEHETSALYWDKWYGGERPMLPELSLDDQKSGRERIEELTPSLNRAADSCAMLSSICW